VIEIRAFRNEDPPRLAAVWRAADLGPAAMQPMTPAMLEASVFSKPYFDRHGLVVAIDDGQMVGFAQAGFGPNADRSGVDTSEGSTLLVAVVPHPEAETIGDRLLAASEAYLGLYGGSDMPGILDSSATMQAVFRRAGYVEHDRVAVLRRALAGFRPPVNRHQLAIRRTTHLRVIDEPARRTWWEAATTTGMALRRYELCAEEDRLIGSASFWDMQPLASVWGVVAAGLLDIEIEGGRRRQGLAHFLLADALQDLAREGVALVETHASRSNVAALMLFSKLGFEAVEHGTLFRRP
jgi:ribosomal protein S18 acetylase RimI-like enzyme